MTILLDMVGLLFLAAWLLCGAFALLMSVLIALEVGRIALHAISKIATPHHDAIPAPPTPWKSSAYVLRDIGIKR
jgi:hypothetical protein